MPKPLKSLPADSNFTKEKMAGMQGVMAQHHRWNTEEREYEAVEGGYVHQDYPRMMYHPEWGKEPMPDMAKFGAGANTIQEAELRNIAFNEALHNWRRKNRTKMAGNAKEFEALKKKGWLDKPPVRESANGIQFDYDSDEI